MPSKCKFIEMKNDKINRIFYYTELSQSIDFTAILSRDRYNLESYKTGN